MSTDYIILIERRAIRLPHLGWRPFKVYYPEDKRPSLDQLSLKHPFHELRIRRFVEETLVDIPQKQE